MIASLIIYKEDSEIEGILDMIGNNNKENFEIHQTNESNILNIYDINGLIAIENKNNLIYYILKEEEAIKYDGKIKFYINRIYCSNMLNKKAIFSLFKDCIKDDGILTKIGIRSGFELIR